MSKTFYLVVLFFLMALEMKAQNDVANDSLQLQEVVVRGARIVSRVDGKVIVPSKEMLNSATSGYKFLKMLPIPNVKVDDINESISSVSSLIGIVQVRIDDVEASTVDIQSLQPKEVKKVEFIDRPGMRCGEDVGIVINIVTRKVSKGYVVGASGTYVPKSDTARGNAYTKLNRGKNELSLNYSGAYSHSNGTSSVEQANYLMEDGAYYAVERNAHNIVSRNSSHNILTRYSMVNAEKSVFLATLSTYFADSPRNSQKVDVVYPDGRKTCETTDSKEKTLNPWLDLYLKIDIDKRQTFIVNGSGAFAHTDYSYLFASDNSSISSDLSDDLQSEHVSSVCAFSNDTFGYCSLGKTWSFKSEAIYENRLKPFTLSAGLRYNQRFIDNEYSGDAALVSQIRSNSMCAFTQIQGSVWKIRYLAGLSLLREYYHQGAETFNELWLRPKFNLSIPLTHGVSLNYTFFTSPAPSKLQNMSNMAIVTNEIEYSLGNPELIVARRDEHTVTANYQSPRFYTQMMMFYRHNAHPAMQHIYRTNDEHFVKTYLEGHRIDFLMLQNYISYDIIPKHLNANLSAEMLNIWNDGQDYSHRLTSFNFNLGLTAWLGKWTLMASVNNGFHFMESDYECRNIYNADFSASYRIKGFSASLFCQNPFFGNRKVQDMVSHNRFISRQMVMRNSETSNVIGIKLSWNFSKGRQFKGVERDVDHSKDTETGVAKPAK